MHHQSHTIIRLDVHLPDQQNIIYFHQGEEEHALLNVSNHDSMIAWLNQLDPDANHLPYIVISRHYTFDGQSRKWKKRLRVSDKVISRIYVQ